LSTNEAEDGGFLQLGSANSENPTALLSETSFKAIVVKPAYRLNIFGFLASNEVLSEPNNTDKTIGNFGFWDLRLALEWTYKNISYFGGDPTNLTLGGYSAGAHAAFYQLAYDLEFPPEKRIVKRVIMQSNGPGVQPKSIDESQIQFNEFLTVLGIPLSLPSSQKMAQLRAMDPQTLLNAVKKMKVHQFRAVTEGVFVRHSLFAEIEDGTFARKMMASNVKLFIGECSDEHFVYGRYFPPAENYANIVQRFEADYPQKAVKAIAKHYFPTGKLPEEFKTWKEAFGKVYADVQIHATQRGFLDALVKGGAGPLITRYRIEWRSKLADRATPKEWGATHGMDHIIWWCGDGGKLDGREKKVIDDALLNHFAAFVKGEDFEWGTSGPLEARRLRTDGKVDIWQDEFREKVKVWDVLVASTKPTASL
jgi:carboxylesterase type B